MVIIGTRSAGDDGDLVVIDLEKGPQDDYVIYRQRETSEGLFVTEPEIVPTTNTAAFVDTVRLARLRNSGTLAPF